MPSSNTPSKMTLHIFCLLFLFFAFFSLALGDPITKCSHLSTPIFSSCDVPTDITTLNAWKLNASFDKPTLVVNTPSLTTYQYCVDDINDTILPLNNCQLPDNAENKILLDQSPIVSSSLKCAFNPPSTLSDYKDCQLTTSWSVPNCSSGLSQATTSAYIISIIGATTTINPAEPLTRTTTCQQTACSSCVPQCTASFTPSSTTLSASFSGPNCSQPTCCSQKCTSSSQTVGSAFTNLVTCTAAPSTEAAVFADANNYTLLSSDCTNTANYKLKNQLRYCVSTDNIVTADSNCGLTTNDLIFTVSSTNSCSSERCSVDQGSTWVPCNTASSWPLPTTCLTTGQLSRLRRIYRNTDLNYSWN